jgi:hypothetical protein
MLRNLRWQGAAKRSKCVASGDGALNPLRNAVSKSPNCNKLGQDRAKFIAVPTTEPPATSDCSALVLHPPGLEILSRLFYCLRRKR